VRVVIADTGPIHYLILIGHTEVLQVLFDRVAIPTAVRNELAASQAPDPVRMWIESPPAWLDVLSPPNLPPIVTPPSLDEGERAAIVLAASLRADLLVMDDRQGVRYARSQGFRVVGTLRVLQLAAQRGLLNLADAFERIGRTKFRCRREIMDELLKENPRP
jgi:predicted nucleic acid-binding protein